MGFELKEAGQASRRKKKGSSQGEEKTAPLVESEPQKRKEAAPLSGEKTVWTKGRGECLPVKRGMPLWAFFC